MKQLHLSWEDNSIICLIGMDGTGKTTYALRIMSLMNESGRKCRYVWFGSPYFFSFPFMIVCRILGLTKIHNLPDGMTNSEHRYFKNKLIALIWPWIQFLDLAIFVSLKVYILTCFGFTVVCDRFVHDILVELMEDTNDTTLYLKTVGRTILKLKPRSALVLLMDVDEMIALKRKNDIPSLNYLTRRRKNFRMIADYLDIPVINTN